MEHEYLIMATPNEYDLLIKTLGDYRRAHLRTVYTFTSTGEHRKGQCDEWVLDPENGSIFKAGSETIYVYDIVTLTTSTVSV